MKASARLRALGGIALLAIAAGCSTEHFRKSADKEAYGVIQAKSPLVQDMDTHFTIEQTNGVSWEGFPTSTNVEAFLGPDGEREQGAHVLSLGDALKTATRSSRSYQSRKEQLYLSALALTLARHEFTPIFSSSGTIDVNYPSSAITGYRYNELTHEFEPVYSDDLVELHSGAGARGDWLIRDVGRITAAFTTDVLRFVAGDPRWFTSSQLSATFARPLLRNAGFKLEMENLTQAERQLLYDIRDFVRYRKDFSVQVATAYYGVLGSRDAVRNSYLNLQSSRKNAERSRALAQEGRITQSDLGRLEQQELSAESSWINEVRTYQQRLDNFKIQLGLDPDAEVILDDRELETLRIHHPVLQVQESIDVALAARLDYLTAKDELVDTERKVKLAANFLKPRVDLVASVRMDSDPDKSKWALPDPDFYRWNAGLDLDPALDRKAERNAYATALISRNRAARAMAQREADIKLEVRDSWRTLEQAKRSYEISEVGVKLAERRVEEQNLLAELGRAKAQDQVDAQNDLISSKNQRTQALVTHTIARLQFWNNLGILFIKENGQWEEVMNGSTR
jgi:outer membrane protein TolC